MARNSLAGKSTGTSKSAKYFAANPEARKKKDAYNKEYHSSPSRIKYRQELNSANRKIRKVQRLLLQHILFRLKKTVKLTKSKYNVI